MEKKDLKYSYNFLLEYKKAIDESSIVSKTDKNGLITFVNKKFCEISGYEEDELIGKSHNIVRHPSMTKEFFNNLWKTIKNKEIFKGVIVNKKKKPHHVSVVRSVRILLQAKTLVEAINTSTGVNQLLLAGIERVALGADFNTNVLLSGAGRKDVATSTANRGLFVFGVDTFLHFVHLFLIM